MTTSDLFSIREKNVVLTGARGGFGRVIAPMLAAGGANLALVDLEEENAADEFIDAIHSKGVRCSYYRCDVRLEDEVLRLVERVCSDFRHIDMLVNNAGYAELAKIENMSFAQFRQTVDVSLVGTFLCTKHFGKHMIARKQGRIVNIASTAGLIGLPRGTAHHAAAKAGVMGFTRTVAVEWAKYGINVNAIAPGQTDSPSLRKIMQNAVDADAIVRNIPLGRIGKPEEIGAAIIYLGSEAGSFITGQTLVIDGGATVL